MKKVCMKCKEEKETNKFRFLTNRSSFYSYCKECENKLHREYYHLKKNDPLWKPSRKKSTTQANKKMRETARRFVFEYLSTHPCIDCPENDPIVLEFDHLRDKMFSVSKMVSKGKCIERIKQEIEKCVIRCSNCHKKKTAKEQGWYKDLLEERRINGSASISLGPSATTGQSG